VKRAINAEISERSRHMLRSVEELIDLSADGFMHATGLDHSDDIFGGVPRSSSDVLTLDVAPQVFDAGSMALGHVRMPGLNPRDWKDLGTVVDACARPLLLDRSLVSYTLGLGLLVVRAAQKFCHSLVAFILEVGELLRVPWSGPLLHGFKALTDGSRLHFRLGGRWPVSGL